MKMKLTDKQKKKLVKDDYNAIADVYAAEDRNIKFYSAFIDKFIYQLDGDLVLDACCGGGEFSNYIAEKDKDVTGIDFSEKLIEIAKSKFSKPNFISSDICDWKPDKSFDGIFSKDALFHLPDRDLKMILDKFYTILKPDGKMLLILDIPKEAGEKIYVEPLDERFSLYYNYLTVDKVKNLLAESNFKINDILIVNESDYEYAQGVMFVYAIK